MKTRNSLVLVIAALVAIMLFSGCPKKDTIAPAITPTDSSSQDGMRTPPPPKEPQAAPQAGTAGGEGSLAGTDDESDTEELALAEKRRAAAAAAAAAAAGSDVGGDLTADRLAGATGSVDASGGLSEEVRRRLGSFTVYFDFDSADLRAEALPVLDQAAAALKSNKKVKILLTGHCDERGTPDYNLALGQRRADNARQYLMGKGVSGKMLETVSMGEEEPADTGHDEAAWAKNRRVVFDVK